MARKRETPPEAPQAVRSTSSYDLAVARYLDSAGLERSVMLTCLRLGVDASLPPRQRAQEVARRSGNAMDAKVNLSYMNAIVDAVESGRQFRREPLTGAEIMAARRATGRMREREPGSDDE